MISLLWQAFHFEDQHNKRVQNIAQTEIDE